jgi:hypothetical protein
LYWILHPLHLLIFEIFQRKILKMRRKGVKMGKRKGNWGMRIREIGGILKQERERRGREKLRFD